MATDEIKKLEQRFESLSKKPDKGASGWQKVGILISIAQKIRYTNPKKAENYGKRAHKLAKKMQYQKGVAKALICIGSTYGVRGQPDKALSLFHEGLDIFKRIRNKIGIGDTCVSIAIAESDKGNFDVSLKWYNMAETEYKKAGFEQNMPCVYMGIGVIYSKTEDFDKALSYFHKAYKISRKINNKEYLAAAVENIGNMNGAKGNFELALKYNKEALEFYEKLGQDQSVAHCEGGAGHILLKMGKYTEAIVHLSNSLSIAEELKDNSTASHACYHIGVAHMNLRHPETALQFLKKSLKIAQQIGKRMQEKDCYEKLHELFKTAHDYKKALAYYKKYAELKDNIFNTEKNKQIAEMQIKYETAQKEKELEIYRIKSVDLRREIRQRKKAEKQLKEYSTHLEELVVARTSKLAKEIVERKKAEQTLLNHQNQLRFLAREVSLIEEKQRRKFAIFLHDDISQALALATFKLRSVQEMDPGTNVKKELTEVRTIIDKTAERTRMLAFEISPPILYELGLEPAVEWLVRKFGKQYRIKSEFKDDGLQKPLTDDASVFLFQSVRGLLSNVAKHAHAKSVTISAVRDGRSIRIAVEDDGIGFSPKSLERKIRENEGFGLFHIRERLRHLHGRMEVQSRKGQGTTMTLIAPLKRAARKKARK